MPALLPGRLRSVGVQSFHPTSVGKHDDRVYVDLDEAILHCTGYAGEANECIDKSYPVTCWLSAAHPQESGHPRLVHHPLDFRSVNRQHAHADVTLHLGIDTAAAAGQ